MARTTQGRDGQWRRLSAAEQAWQLLRDVGAFLIGGYMLIHETQGTDPPSELLVIVGVALLGVTGSGIAQRLLDRGDQP